MMLESGAVCFDIARGFEEPGNRKEAVIETSAGRIAERLDALRSLSPEFEAAALVSIDGLVIASSMPAEIVDQHMAAMSAAMLALGERIADELGRGALEQVFIKGDRGCVLLMAVADVAILTALASDEAKLGLLFLDMRRAASDLQALV